MREITILTIMILSIQSLLGIVFTVCTWFSDMDRDNHIDPYRDISLGLDLFFLFVFEVLYDRQKPN